MPGTNTYRVTFTHTKGQYFILACSFSEAEAGALEVTRKDHANIEFSPLDDVKSITLVAAFHMFLR